MKKIGLVIEIYKVKGGAVVIKPEIINNIAFNKFKKTIRKNEVKRIKI